jgi:hypothetical protein
MPSPIPAQAQYMWRKGALMPSVSTCDELISLNRRRKSQLTMLISLLIISVNISQKVMNI